VIARRAPAFRLLAALTLAAALTGCDTILPASPEPSRAAFHEPTAAPTQTPVPTAAAASSLPSAPPALIDYAVVPVVGWRLAWTTTSPAEVVEVLRGDSDRYAAIELTSADRDALVPVLAVPDVVAGGAARVIVARDAASLVSDLAAHPDRLGFLRADDVVPAVRAIGWNDLELFGTERVTAIADWPLWIEAPPPDRGHVAYDPASAWTIVAGGDVNLDGNVAYTIKNKGKGVDYPWDGGTARITSRYCCSTYGFEMARVKRTGHGGAIRELLSGADLAIVNFENPAPDDFTYHAGGFSFSADPALIEGLKNAGIDWVSLANNHIGNAGRSGVVETLANLDEWGIAHGGAGADLAEARAPSILKATSTSRVAILAYDTIKPVDAATADRPGSNQMTADRVRKDVARARDAGADVVIVFPHWGIEYTVEPSKRQRALAHAAIDAGADLVLGNHTHWVGGIEVYKGKPIVYSMANFVFSIRRSEKTMEGILVESTFSGARLVQLRVHPFFIIDGVQPNLLEPDGGADAVMDQLFEGSGALLPW
jgi:poly-gamma-glutamate capsule biosynthesis protein CapA/YwtB (metallophosphatase superfamily)